ncbi:MAG: hypothetical protein OEY00_07530, partial [Gammaproteobacteria bacterium]|nr:hypothetical protein [Gammaproteobacteria bacterium]
MINKLTLFIPDLLNAPLGLEAFAESEQPKLPALLRLLSRAEISHDANANYFYELMQRFCLIHSGGDIPAGSISHFIRTGEHDQKWRL